MANTRYENFVIENKLNELLNTSLAMNQFLTVDNTLQEEAGMIKKVHRYSSTGAGQDVQEGAGNNTAIEMSYSATPYTVGTYQARFIYTDEDAMADPFLVDAGIQNLAKDIVNDYNHKAIIEWGKGTHRVGTTTFDFDAFADALAELDLEDVDEANFFALCSVDDRAELRKNLKDTLQYVEANARTGYVGSVCGVPIYTSKAVFKGEIFLANKEAVSAFMKKDTEIAQARDENTRTNTVYARNVKVIALTNNDKVCKISKYEAGVPSSNPKTEGFFEYGDNGYVATTDTTKASGKTYYKLVVAA